MQNWKTWLLIKKLMTAVIGILAIVSILLIGAVLYRHIVLLPPEVRVILLGAFLILIPVLASGIFAVFLFKSLDKLDLAWMHNRGMGEDERLTDIELFRTEQQKSIVAVVGANDLGSSSQTGNSAPSVIEEQKVVWHDDDLGELTPDDDGDIPGLRLYFNALTDGKLDDLSKILDTFNRENKSVGNKPII